MLVTSISTDTGSVGKKIIWLFSALTLFTLGSLVVNSVSEIKGSLLVLICNCYAGQVIRSALTSSRSGEWGKEEQFLETF